MKSLFCCLILSALLFTSCSKEEIIVEQEVLIFGTYAGECIGNCADFYKIENGQLFADDTEWGIPDDIPFLTTPLGVEEHDLAEVLQTNFPAELLESDQRIYGCPDCADQGGIYLELRRGDQVDKWQLDTDDVEQSETIIAYKEQIFTVLQALR